MSSSWKFVKRPRFLLRGACEVVLDLAISEVEKKLTIIRSPCEGIEEEGELP
jgi:hypothetical protein